MRSGALKVREVGNTTKYNALVPSGNYRLAITKGEANVQSKDRRRKHTL